MISKEDFNYKQILLYYPKDGEKISLNNDNLVIKNKDGTIKFQSTCYRIFAIFVVGTTVVTTEIIKKANQYGFTICLFSNTFKLYEIIGHRIEGNTMLHKKQYSYEKLDIGKCLIKNKIQNQAEAIKKIRHKSTEQVLAIEKLSISKNKLDGDDLDFLQILGIEGSASKLYFNSIFDTVGWNGRKPRIKYDYINATLDIGYTVLFNIIDALLGIYGFDTYYGVLHRCFYMRKSLVCDLIEPVRPIIDLRVRKAINWGEISEKDFKKMNNKYLLKWEKSPKYTQIFVEEIMKHREELFLYIQNYYRNFMKGPNPESLRGFKI